MGTEAVHRDIREKSGQPGTGVYCRLEQHVVGTD